MEKGGGLRKGLPTLQPKPLFLGDALAIYLRYVGRRVGKLLRNPPFAARGRRCVEKGGGLRKGLPTLQSKLLFVDDA